MNPKGINPSSGAAYKFFEAIISKKLRSYPFDGYFFQTAKIGHFPAKFSEKTLSESVIFEIGTFLPNYAVHLICKIIPQLFFHTLQGLVENLRAFCFIKIVKCGAFLQHEQDLLRIRWRSGCGGGRVDCG